MPGVGDQSEGGLADAFPRWCGGVGTGESTDRLPVYGRVIKESYTRGVLCTERMWNHHRERGIVYRGRVEGGGGYRLAVMP